MPSRTPGVIRSRGVALHLAAATLVAACSTAAPVNAVPTSVQTSVPTGRPPSAMVDKEVTFDSGGVSVAGSMREASEPGGGPRPAAVLIAGSGPTDRDGNSALAQGDIGTLRFIADELARGGVASLRYDKPGTGRTGLGPYATSGEPVDLAVFSAPVAAAVTFTRQRPGVDGRDMTIVGHSEGALLGLAFAATSKPGSLRRVVLVAPPARRYLDLAREQVTHQLAAAVQSGSIPAATAREMTSQLDAAIRAVRTGAPLPAPLTPPLAGLFNPANARFLAEIDRIDPVAVARSLPKRLSVLVVCADKDIQVSCADTRRLVAALRERPGAVVRFEQLRGVNHVLKEVGTQPSTGAEYTAALPFSRQFARALARFVKAG